MGGCYVSQKARAEMREIEQGRLAYAVASRMAFQDTCLTVEDEVKMKFDVELQGGT